MEGNGFIFGNTEYVGGVYKRYFYKYDIKNENICKINKDGINACESASYNSQILNNYIYTNSYEMQENGAETSIYRVNLTDGKVDKLYSTAKNVNVILLSERYAFLRGSDFEMDEANSDLQFHAQDECEYAFLCDLEEKIEYEIKDKRVVLGIRDYFIPYSVDSSRYIIFEEAYMEDWELEALFNEGLKKEQFYHDGYRESINIISLNKFVQSVKEELQAIPFIEIHKSELTGGTRYFGMDDHKIYYRSKDFESKVENIYSVDKKTLGRQLIKSIQIDSNEPLYSYFYIWHDINNRKIYEIKIIDNKIKEVREILHGDFNIQFDDIREGIHGFIDNYIITGYWTEDDDGDNYRNFVKIRDMKNGTADIYEGNSVIINDYIILFL